MKMEELLRPITEQEIQTFEDDGIVCLRQMFSLDWVEKMREAAEVSMAKPGELHAELSEELSLIHISEPTRQEAISYAVF